jgi:hypothetical protein
MTIQNNIISVFYEVPNPFQCSLGQVRAAIQQTLENVFAAGHKDEVKIGEVTPGQ